MVVFSEQRVYNVGRDRRRGTSATWEAPAAPFGVFLREDEKHGTWQKEDKVEKMKITVVGTGYVGLSLAVFCCHRKIR